MLITFLLADPGNSLQLWEQHAAALQAALPRYRQIFTDAICQQQGEIISCSNDTLQAAFSDAALALQAAQQAQLALLAQDWDLPLQPRLALLTGMVQRQGDEYIGSAPHRLARLLSVAHPGQVLLCPVTAGLLRERLPEGVSLLDLGEHRLPDLSQPEQIYQLAVAGLPLEFPPLKSLDNQPTNLPAQPNELVGRQAELDDLSARLRTGSVRLLTLTGMGGAGKTRLALQTAADLLAAFPDGVFFVPLDAISAADLVPSAIAEALAIELSSNQSVEQTLIEHLRRQRTLLVLDNFEHLLEAAGLVSTLLAACPQLKILVTSREALRLRGEHEFPVPPLASPSQAEPLEKLAQFAAVALFEQRARAVRPDFRIDSASAPAVAEICSYLDGLPLAIELAAARLRLFSAQALLARLKAQPALQTLASGARDLPLRQQTLHKTLEWSYTLLSPAEQALFRRLGVFAGSFSLEAVEALAGVGGEPPQDVLDLLASLVEKNLLRREEDAEGGLRFSMLYLLRQFALELLEGAGELADCQAAHAAWYAALAERIEPELFKNDQACWYGVLGDEHDNLRLALGWSIATGQVETGLRLVGALYRFWANLTYLQEGRRWVEQVLSLPGAEQAPGALRAKGLLCLSAMADLMGDFATARSAEEQRIEIYRQLGDRQGIARSLGNLGYKMIQQGNGEAGAPLVEESIARYREIDDPRGLAVSLIKLSLYYMDLVWYDRARILLEESLAVVEKVDDLEVKAFTYSNLGLIELYQGNYEQARKYLEETLQLHQALGQQLYTNETLGWLGYVLLLQGSLQSARANFEQSLRASQQVGEKMGIAENLEGLAGLAVRRGNPQRATRLFGATEALREQIELPLPPSDQKLFAPLIVEAQAGLKKDEFSRLWDEGRQMLAASLDDAIAFALQPDEAPGKASSKSSMAGLTAREAEILRLLAQGMTDSQIAAALYISPRTVNAHLTSVYNKLGVSSRTAATRYAIENGMA